MAKAVIKMLGAGGAGIAVTKEISDMVNGLGSGFAKIEPMYIDTSIATIGMVDDPDKNFYHIKSVKHNGPEISGSGSERKTNIDAIVPGVKEFLDNNGINKMVTGEYYIVAFSASGASGSTSGPILVRELMARNIPVIALVIADSTSGLYAINTKNTIATLNNFALNAKKALSVVYVNNESFINLGASKAIKEANRSLFNSVASLAVFLSGNNYAIDDRDMINLIDQSNYSTIKVPAGLYALNTFSKEVIIPEGCVATGARTLTTESVSPDINMILSHSKSGIITDPNVIEIYGKDVPLHLVTYVNMFTMEMERLQKFTDGMYASMNAIEVNEISGTSKSTVDENGFIL